ncbi:MAG: ParB/RepB/Spo0J family partition protein [Patescibacteria group bacterium]
MVTKKKSGLGRGLGALIPQANSRVVTREVNTEDTANEDVSRVISAATPTEDSGVFEISLSEIQANIDQPRTAFSHQAMEELTESVRQHGILQPLAVTPLGAGRYELIAGERRLRAAKMAGLKSVPVYVRSTGGVDKLVLALIENIQREDLNPVEEARAYRRLTDEFNLTQEEVSTQVGKARSTVANTLRLLDLPDEMLDAVATGVVSAGNARALLAVSDPKSRLKMFRKMLAGKMTVREAEAGAQKNSNRTRKDPQMLATEEDLREAYGTKVQVTSRGGKGKIILQFFSDEEYERLLKKLLG